LNIPSQRLHNQRLAANPFEKPEDVVKWLAAVQAQDFAAAKWALGLRLRDAADSDIDQAFNDGKILRTHVLRPTWHFVLPEDIRWLLALTAPRVHAFSAYYYRRLELGGVTLARTNAILAKALEGGKQLTRKELGSILQQQGIDTWDNLRLTYIVIHAELEAVICSGPRRGKQFTYALLDERAPSARNLERDEALAELTLRYFTSHGPATIKDFVWWSGLTAVDAKTGLEMVKSQLVNEVTDGQTYWVAPSSPSIQVTSPTAYLLPNFDEYTVAYTEHRESHYLSSPHAPQRGRAGIRSDVILGNVIVIDGQIVGTWKRTLNRDTVIVETRPFTELNDAENQALAAVASRYGAFLSLQTTLT